MKLLIDTHIFIWLIEGSSRLSRKARGAFLNKANTFYLSAASYWELCTKLSLGKLQLASDWQEKVDEEMLSNGIKWLTIDKAHCQLLLTLPFLHRDPFDRLLVAQAIHERMSILTEDKFIKSYAVKTLW